MMTALSKDNLRDLQFRIEELREAGEDYLILSVGVRGPNLDCHEGNSVVTVRMGNDTATSEALRLEDAILLARGKIRDERAAREKARAEAKANG